VVCGRPQIGGGRLAYDRLRDWTCWSEVRPGDLAGFLRRVAIINVDILNDAAGFGL